MDSRHSAVAANVLLGLSYGSREAALKEDYPRVLALLSGHFIGMEEGFAAMRSLSRQKVRLQLWPEQRLLSAMSAGELAGRAGVDDILLPGRSSPPSPAGGDADALFIPVLSLPLLSRLTVLDTGHPFVSLIVQSLCAGKPVAALALGAEPEHYCWGEQGLSHATPLLKDEIRAMAHKIEGFGIRLLEPGQAGSWLSGGKAPQKKQVLTAEDIYAAHRLGRTSIVLNGPAVITPLARDAARQYGIELI
ncbi:hypothetical protein [Paenibacillus sp. S150]|uniref:hypothetical protein n=1 Tax=Paenibacillus sp. S150 TaxID=2749826 RepID=UPI001C57F3D3|nr:hypothetical protein [Paenibacillus sp. S150]MBW4082795.1 hypothetical protein [Paenibacillus sp. S150]